MTIAPIPRSPLGEWGYRGLWMAVLGLPALLLFVRWLTVEQGIVWMLSIVVGLPAVLVAQALLAMVAWVYRQRQWRHWLGTKTAIASFVYYGLWLLLALSLPDNDSGAHYPSAFQSIFGIGEQFSTFLIWATGAAYVATLVGIIVEGERAVATDPSGRSVSSIISGIFEEKFRTRP